MELEISLNDLRFYSYHGVYEEEKRIGNEFRVSLSVFIPFNNEMEKDLLSSTLSYASLFEIIKEEMDKSCNLMEKVALNIVKKIKSKFSEVKSGRIRIEKVHPPIPGILGSASITLNF